MNTAIKAIFFDMDDTLVLTSEADTKACVHVGRLAQQLIPQIDLLRLFGDWHRRFVTSPWDPTNQVDVSLWRSQHWLAALQDQGFADEDAAHRLQQCFDSTRLSLFRFEPGVKDMLLKLRATGLRMVVITNGHHQIQRTKLQACGAADLFDGILVGGEEVLAGRAEKPHPQIFWAACQIAGCQPHEAIHIGDSLTADIAGGKNAGLHATVWVNRRGDPVPAHVAARPNYVVKHVTDLTQVLAEIDRLK